MEKIKIIKIAERQSHKQSSFVLLADLKLELVDMRTDTAEIRSLIDEMDLNTNEGHRLRHKGTNSADYHSLKGLANRTYVGSTLK